MPILTLALKDLRLLLRDARSAVILFVTPLVLILVLGLALGEGFGEKPDERLRISVVNLWQLLARTPAFVFGFGFGFGHRFGLFHSVKS